MLCHEVVYAHVDASGVGMVDFVSTFVFEDGVVGCAVKRGGFVESFAFVCPTCWGDGDGGSVRVSNG